MYYLFNTFMLLSSAYKLSNTHNESNIGIMFLYLSDIEYPILNGISLKSFLTIIPLTSNSFNYVISILCIMSVIDF